MTKLLLLVMTLMSIAIYSTVATDTMYVFAYSWQPGFCKGTTYPGCSTPEAFWSTHFTVHGLWPQYTTSGYPSYCSTEAFNSTIPVEIGWDTMTQYWPDVKYTETNDQYDSFWEHEWDKHGTCSGLTQENYFQDAINLIESFGTPSVLSAAAGSTISATTLRNAFGGSTFVSLQCTSMVLTGAYTCWLQSDGVPTTQVACPTEVQGEDTCKSSDTITVPTF